MHICLIRPPSVTNTGVKGQNPVPPIGLAYIAGALRTEGHRVSIVDAVGMAPDSYRRVEGVSNAVAQGLSAAEIAQAVPADVDLIGVSCMFSMEWLEDRAAIRAIGARLPGVPLVLGGEHSTACWEHILETCPEVDFCVLGEGENTIVELVTALAEGADTSSIEGLALRGPDGPRRGRSRARERKIDALPRPSWEGFPLDNYLERDLVWGVNLGASMPILASRGCPYRCTFCSSPQMWTTLWKARTPADVVDEMKLYMERYGARAFSFYDLTAIVKKRWIVDFCELVIAEGLDVRWQLPSGTRSEAIDEEVAGLLFRAGCRHLNYAPESGSPAVLKRIRKEVKLPRMLASAAAAHRAGLRIKANIIFGFPDETGAEMWETYQLLARLAWVGVRDVGSYVYSPYPGSELFEQLRDAGEVEYSDAYFESLVKLTDPKTRVSYSQHFDGEQLALIAMGSTALFYLVAYTRRPWRVAELVSQLVRGDQSSRLSKQLLMAVRKAKHTTSRGRGGLRVWAEALTGQSL